MRTQRRSRSDDVRFNRRPISAAPLRDIVDGYVEVVASLADAAGRLSNAAIDNDPCVGARTNGDVLRQTPDAVERTAFALNDELISAQQRIVDFLDLRNWDFRRSADRPDLREPALDERGLNEREFSVGTAPNRAASERDIVVAARGFLNRSPLRSATLDGLTKYLRRVLPVADHDLHSVVERNFRVDRDLVFLAHSTAEGVGLAQSVEAHLRALGYNDLRRDVPLERLEGTDASARLVAYDGNEPAVVVALVARGRLNDALDQDHARVQAKSLSKTSEPRYVYLTDGSANLYLDVETGTPIAELPRASGTATPAE
jgi:hypothetical protein